MSSEGQNTAHARPRSAACVISRQFLHVKTVTIDRISFVIASLIKWVTADPTKAFRSSLLRVKLLFGPSVAVPCVITCALATSLFTNDTSFRTFFCLQSSMSSGNDQVLELHSIWELDGKDAVFFESSKYELSYVRFLPPVDWEAARWFSQENIRSECAKK